MWLQHVIIKPMVSTVSSFPQLEQPLPVTLGYLGPMGSHSHQACYSLLKRVPFTAALELVPYPTLSELMEAVAKGHVAMALLPYENALEGSVVEVIETLSLRKKPLWVHAELLYPVMHCLIQHTSALKPEVSSKVHTLLSHPQALAQCREAILKTYGASVICKATESTSEAVRQLALMENPEGVAAIGTRSAAALYGLSVVKPQFSDCDNNLTRFFLISNAIERPAVCGSLEALSSLVKTSLCVSLPEYSGALVDFLSLFKAAGVNLSKVESRPTRKHYGDYYFYIDMEGDLHQVQEGKLLKSLTAFAHFLYSQGAYVCLGLTSEVVS
jgi:prephenate dehydratase